VNGQQQETNYKRLYSVRDSKAECYLQVFTAKTAGEALRGFTREANNRQSIIGEHPEDFALFELGYWCEDTGTLMPHEQNRNLGLAADFVQKMPQEVPAEYIKPDNS
jgi:hypothetical protein